MKCALQDTPSLFALRRQAYPGVATDSLSSSQGSRFKQGQVAFLMASVLLLMPPMQAYAAGPMVLDMASQPLADALLQIGRQAQVEIAFSPGQVREKRAVALQAQALAPLRVCGVAPGLMFLSGPQTQENFDRNSRVNLLREPIDPAQVAATCLFLAQNPCITGTTVCVDNGQHLVPLARDVMFLGEPKDPA